MPTLPSLIRLVLETDAAKLDVPLTAVCMSEGVDPLYADTSWTPLGPLSFTANWA